jgi:hypothetical protein
MTPMTLALLMALKWGAFTLLLIATTLLGFIMGDDDGTEGTEDGLSVRVGLAAAAFLALFLSLSFWPGAIAAWVGALMGG